MDRRAYLVAGGTSLAVTLGGCLGHEAEPNAEPSCRETWNVILYNESDEAKSATITIFDSEREPIFSDTVDIDPDTDRSTGIELGAGVDYERSYVFEVALSENESLSEETEINCGNVYIFVTESGELDLRADEADH